MLFSRAKIPCFRVKVHLVFHWYLGSSRPPLTHMRFCFKTNIFPQFGLHGVHTYPVKTVTENASFFLQSLDF